MIRAAIFDIDGTLIDSVDLHARAWADALRHFGFDAPYPAIRQAIGMGGDKLLPEFVPADVLKERQEEIETFRADLFKSRFLGDVRPFASVPDLFRRIRDAGARVVLASSGKADEVERYVDILGVADLVDNRTTSDDAAESKPAPHIFQAALSKLDGIGPDEAIVIGDTRWDVIAARGAGLRTIGLTCGGVPEDELRQAGAVAVFRSPSDLLARYDGSPLAI